MITRIGIVAGEIWEYLDQHDKTASLKSIIADSEAERELVLMSIGWLAREGHISLKGGSSDYVVKLKNAEEK